MRNFTESDCAEATRPSLFVVGAAMVATAGCADDAEVHSGQDAGPSMDSDAPVEPPASDASADAPLGPSLGGFTIRLVAPVSATSTPGFTTAIGKIHDVPVPPLLVWERIDEDGDCFLQAPKAPFCEQACSGVCVADDVCAPQATAQSVGTVTLTGVRRETGETRIILEPLLPLNIYQVAETLPYPAFDEADPILLEATGGDFASFVIRCAGIRPLELDGQGDIPVTPGEVLPLRWTSGEEPSARIQVEIDISHHGGTRGAILCDTDDDGSLDVSATLVTGLIDLGVSGFPVVDVTRHADGSAPVGRHRVDLSVVSTVQRGLQLPGVISCSDDAQCPNGRTCQFDMQCG